MIGIHPVPVRHLNPEVLGLGLWHHEPFALFHTGVRVFFLCS